MGVATAGVYLSATVIYKNLKTRGELKRTSGGRHREGAALRGVAAKRDVGERLDQAHCGRSARVLGDGDRFLFTMEVAWEVAPTVHAGVMKAIYEAELSHQGISKHSVAKPQLRVDRGSSNPSGITQEFSESLGAELSFARVRRPTDNALTERFHGTFKQEEIYLVGNYPDEISAKEESGVPLSTTITTDRIRR